MFETNSINYHRIKDSGHPAKVTFETTKQKRITLTPEMDYIEVYKSEKVYRVLQKYSRKACRYTDQARDLVSENEKLLERHKLQSVTADELLEIRKKQIPIFILKLEGERLFYTEIPKRLSFLKSACFGVHVCAGRGSTDVCEHLSTASDARGGCAKVRCGSIMIERFPFIKVGYETYCTNKDVFVVIECANYERCKPKDTLSFSEIKKVKRSLHDLYFN